DLHFGVGVDDDSGEVDIAFASAAGEDVCAACSGFVHPFGDALDFAFGNHGSDIDALVKGIADDHGVGGGDEFFGEGFVDFVFAVDALGADADLSAVVKRS